MKLFDEVAVITDERMAESADALRRLLESFRLRVHFHRIVQRGQAEELFASGAPTPEWTVLMSHGITKDDDALLRLAVVGNDSGDPQAAEGWYATTLDLTPQTIPDIVKNARGTWISGACGGGHPNLAAAFLEAGCDAYVGCRQSYVDGQAMVLFIAGVFYFLLAEDRDHAPRSYELDEAVRRAAAFDPGWNYGTGEFQCFTR